MESSLLVIAGIVMLIGLSLGLHRLFEGECLPLDLWTEWRLARADLGELDRRLARRRSDRSALIVSLTTTPSRLPLIGLTLSSLMTQSRPPAVIQLNIPDRSRREGVDYVIPDWLSGLSCVRIVRCQDWGPATKLIPTLAGLEPDQPVVIVDDDRVYPPHLLASLESAARRLPDAALGLSGWRVPADLTDRPTTVFSNLFMRPPAPVRATRLGRPYRVDILQGMSGVLLRPRFLEPLTDYASAPEAAFFVDDVWIAGHCRVPKFVIPVRRMSFLPWRRRGFYQKTSLGLLNRGGGDPERRHNTIMVRFLADRWRDGASRD